MRLSLRSAVTAVATIALAFSAVSSANAAPPSEDDIAAAKRHEVDTQSSISGIETTLANLVAQRAQASDKALRAQAVYDDALAAAEHGLQGRDEHDKAEEAIDDGRDAGQQIDGGLQHAVEPLRAEARQIQRAQQAQRDADEDRAARDEDAGDDHGEDAVEVLIRRPGHAEQEFAEADLMHGGDAVGKQENADERHGKDGDAGRQQEDDLHGPFPNGVEIVFHSSS